MNEAMEPSTSSPLLLHIRREPFEYGLLPIPKLIFSDAITTLTPLKQKLLQTSSSSRIDSTGISETLQISIDNARLLLETLASILPSDSDPLSDSDPDSVGANVYDLILFLYIQSYKRLLPRTHKDSAAIADVWPSTSAFDGYLSALTPLQLVRSNTRRFMPSQADEEAHQLSYIQKHLANILALLAEPVEGNEDESLVFTSERFEHLGFLIQFGEKGSEGNLLSQASPFFANSDPDMPAVPVPASQVHDWVVQNIVASLEHTTEKILAKENGSHSVSDLDVTMADASVSNLRGQSTSPLSGTSMHSNAAYSRSQTFVEGISKSSIVKQASDIKGCSVKVINCHDSVIYILAPLKYATVYGCSDATIVLGAIGKVAPYNTFYSQLEEHLTQVGVDATINRWDEPLVLGMVDPHDSLSHPAGVSDAQSESATCLDPDQFTDFLIPNWFGGESPQLTKQNPFPLPEIYMASQKKKHLALNESKEALKDLQLEENRKRELASALHVYFKEWLYASGNIRQLYCLQGD
ncbi:uncharacterized protein LOC143846632 isoform X2 [Tasmannia lanceolata]|uniref:uncharacterized protein LOC143846632 isoform X2 n=1 Tax=Tasmannia lanceolata TaxID=3420 RepID=UPI004062F213